MLSSMTAFGRSEVQLDKGHIIWEIKTVNHRYLDVSFKLPDCFKALEISLREALRNRIARGKVECSLRFVPGAKLAPKVSINQPLVKGLIQVSKEIEQLIGANTPIEVKDIIRYPGTVDMDYDYDVELYKDVTLLFEKVLEKMIKARLQEGEALAYFIREKLAMFEVELSKARALTSEAVSENRMRLLKRFNELQINVETSRIEQELAILVQRLDVIEELDRLEAHIKEVRRLLNEEAVLGRRLDFLMQEFNREANTLASKSNNAQLTVVAVEMKVLIEQMREQIQNIE
jgi:uncharacterized protein (TIGR00255 family)